LSRPRPRSRPNTLKAKAIISRPRPRPLEKKTNNNAKNNHVEITIVAIMHCNYRTSVTNVCNTVVDS